ncbi:hypothetical protein ACFU6R_11765 [Streptomyces sp. NPDC057499]|uniref:hypothetical protein n=1 Tax=Streptomyces sp. NPDC057499 TaxID=3346150 RepID=UPI00369F71E4
MSESIWKDDVKDVLFGEMPVCVVPGDPMPWSTRLSSDLLAISGPYRSADEHEQHLLETSGAGSWVDDGNDELRFSLDTGELVSVWLAVPGSVAPDSADLGAWLRAGRVEGRPAVMPGTYFDLPPASVRWCDGSGSVLVCLTEEGFSGDAAVRSRLRIAHDLDLLIADGRYMGWLLEHPATRLSDSWAGGPDSPEDPELGAWLARYIALSDDDVFDAIVDGDPTPLEPLRELLADVRTVGGDRPRRRIFRDALDDVIDRHTGFHG